MKVIDELIESARLAGSTQAKRGYGVYTQDDAIMERAFWEGVEARAKAIRDEVAALKAERDAAMKDAERLDYLQKHARCDPKMDGNHVWWPTTFNQAQNLRGGTLREAIDAAIAKAEGEKS